jgi:hypothetical protein
MFTREQEDLFEKITKLASKPEYINPKVSAEGYGSFISKPVELENNMMVYVAELKSASEPAAQSIANTIYSANDESHASTQPITNTQPLINAESAINTQSDTRTQSIINDNVKRIKIDSSIQDVVEKYLNDLFKILENLETLAKTDKSAFLKEIKTAFVISEAFRDFAAKNSLKQHEKVMNSVAFSLNYIKFHKSLSYVPEPDAWKNHFSYYSNASKSFLNDLTKMGVVEIVKLELLPNYIRTGLSL